MSHKIIDQQPRKLRLILPVSKTLSLAVFDDPTLFHHDDYAPGVMASLKKAWKKNDYLEVVAIGSDGEILDSVSSMAGYGGPKKAAEAALQDYFSSYR